MWGAKGFGPYGDLMFGFLGDVSADGVRDRINCGPGHITYLEHRDRTDVLTGCEEISVLVID